MTKDEFAIHYHSLQFRLACHENKASAFQAFFEKVMQKHDPTFVSVKPSGKEGDWKCDGFSQGEGIVYQCYAPEQITHAKAASKIKTDFDGARAKWPAEMKKWIFVWSAEGALPPQAVKALQQLKTDAPKEITIDDWGREALWKIVAAFSLTDRTELLGIVPEPSAAADTTAAEIQVLLGYLVRQDFSLQETGLELTELREKITKNRLSDSMVAMIKPAVPVSSIVEGYANRHPDTDFSALVASILSEKYTALKGAGGEADQIFWDLVAYVNHGPTSDAKTFWAAVGIVTHYFQLCDIFER